MTRITLAIACVLSLAFTPLAAFVSDEARAHIKCFANLSQALFTQDMRAANPDLEQQRQRHEELFMMLGRQELSDSNFKFGVDHFLGGYEQRVFDSQTQRLRCNNPGQIGECTEMYTTEVLSLFGMSFYERENCRLLLD
jgi:hypothetical protein